MEQWGWDARAGVNSEEGPGTACKEANERGGPACPRTRAFLMAHASTLTINIYRTRQEGALYLLVN